MKINLNSNKINTTKILKNDLDFIPIQCLISFKFASSIYGFILEQIIKKSLNDKKEPIGLIEQFLNVDLDEQKFKYDLSNSSWSCRRYSVLFRDINTPTTTRTFWGSDGRLRGNFHLGELGSRDKIVYNLCIKKEYIRYFLQCVLLEREPDNRIFTLLIDNTFDTTNSIAPRIRPHFRKYVRKKCLDLGIELKYESNLDELFYETYKLEASTPMELKQIKKDLVLELLTI